MGTGRRGQLVAYLLAIGVNLAVLPNWFSPGRFSLTSRLLFVGLSVLVVAFCAWRISQILGVNPFTRLKHPTYRPYQEPADDDPAVEPRDRSLPRRWGQAHHFREYDPYEEAPQLPDPARSPETQQLGLGTTPEAQEPGRTSPDSPRTEGSPRDDRGEKPKP